MGQCELDKVAVAGDIPLRVAQRREPLAGKGCLVGRPVGELKQDRKRAFAPVERFADVRQAASGFDKAQNGVLLFGGKAG